VAKQEVREYMSKAGKSASARAESKDNRSGNTQPAKSALLSPSTHTPKISLPADY
jgi:hypothetical protein